MSQFTFWVGWDADDSIPDAHMIDKWPTGMKGWRSGYAGDTENGGFSTWVARIDAATAEEAEKIARSCYTESSDKIRMRWDPEQHELGYRPTGGRFPE
jgi:hypothetical protein